MDNNNSKASIEYFVYPNLKKFYGINNKVSQIILALNKDGFHAKAVTAPSGIMGTIQLIKFIFSSSADIIIFRNTFLMPIFIPAIIWQRVKGTALILDIPTPLTNVLNEFKYRSNIGVIPKALRIITVIIFYPWVLLPFSKILQYAPESPYFSFLCNKKTVRITNGIDVSSFPLRNRNKNNGSLQLIGVANLVKWHGFDRVIRGISEYCNKSESRKSISFIIVGEGQEKKELEALSLQLGISHLVTFTGFVKGEPLDILFDQADIAISAIGLFRTNLEEASALKSREYTARGVPFISTGVDIDFDLSSDFVFKVENTEASINIEEIIKWYEQLIKDESLEKRIRGYAVQYLDFNRKISDFLPIVK